MHLCWGVPVRMTFGSLVAAALVATLASACGGGTTAAVTEITAPDPVRCQTSVSSNPSTFPHAGSRATLTVSAGRECSWTAASEASWAQVSPTTGQGEASITIAVDANPDARTRTAALVINNTRLSLSQEAAPCRFQLGRTQERMSHEGGRTNVQVTAPGGCEWRATTNESWVRVSPQTGSGIGTVEMEASANSSGERTAVITIAQQPFTLAQDARPTTPTPNPGPSPAPPPGSSPTCPIAIDSTERSFGAGGGDGSIRVTAPPGCSWSASTTAPWIDISGSNGTGNDTVRYKVASNPATSARTGAIAVGSQTHTVRQEAAAPGGGGGGGGGGEERIELSGRAFFVEGSCPSLSFWVDLRRVFTNGDTRFRGGNCRDIRPGVDVSVEGRLQSDGRIRAVDVRIRDDDD